MVRMEGTYGPPQGSCHVVLGGDRWKAVTCASRGVLEPVPLSLALAFPLRPHCSDLLAPRKAGQTSRESKGCFTTSPLAC